MGDCTKTRCFIALGGNQGDVAATVRSALSDLAVHAEIDVGAISTNHASPAVGVQAGGGFLNAAAELSTTLFPHELLAQLHTVESYYGRRRDVHWGPRTLDLDLILYGDQVVDSPDLRVPHPACWYRRFVLEPMAEIAADVVHPVKGVTFAELRSRLLLRPLPVGLTGGNDDDRLKLWTAITAEFPRIRIQPDWSPGDELPALLFRLSVPAGENAFRSPLPMVDLPPDAERMEFVRDVLHSALGE